MKEFFKQNPLIAASILLPLVVIALFAVATSLPRMFIDPPAFDFLIVDLALPSSEQRSIDLEFSIEDGAVVATIHHLEPPRNKGLSRLYRFNHQTSVLEEVFVPLPEDVSALPSGSRVDVVEVEGLKIDPALTAPDGYEYLGHEGSSGLIMEFFGGNRTRSSLTVARGGAKVRVRLPGSGRWYRDVRFLGWVVD